MAQINIMAARHSAFYTPLIYTIAGGFLEEEGLEPTYTVAKAPEDVAANLTGGAMHLSQLAVSRSWGWLEKGETPPLVHFAQINERDGFFLAGREADPDFAWDKLAGAEVLVDHGAQPLAMFKYAAAKMGLDYDTIQAIDAGGVADMNAAFRAGQGSYVHLQGPGPQQLEHDGVAHVVASVGEAIGPIAFSSLAATWPWLETEMAAAFMRAYAKARQRLGEIPAAEIAAAEADYFDGVDREVLSSTIAFYQQLGTWNPETRITEESYDVALDVFLAAGLISKRHAYADCVATPPGAA
ncbi:MAG: ABC transporter substrate-binding protein [Alphaproteobacteria bacterium]|jgi:NitT/TauT family transport system substrate-binding protein|nr:ABC transporter substrate-binding protein [Alphaproteobacteria bacterium]